MRRTLFSTFQKTDLTPDDFLEKTSYGTLVVFPDQSYFSTRSARSLLDNREWISEAKLTVTDNRIITVEDL